METSGSISLKRGVAKGPIQWFQGIPTFLRAPMANIEDLKQGMIAIYGAPHDTGSRGGARYGARRCREASLHLSYYVATDSSGELYDLDNNRTYRWKGDSKIVDLCDTTIFLNDTEKTAEAIREASYRIVKAGAFPVMLGGDHMTSYPACAGFVDAVREKKPNAKIGILHFDAHTDIGDENPVTGRINNATPIRRISELQGVDTRKISMLCMRGLVRKDHYRFIVDSGINFYPMSIIRERGWMEVVKEAVEKATDGCDTVYCTVDQDCVDPAFAPGNSGIAFAGITSEQLLQAIDYLSFEQKIGAIDLVEFNPLFDAGEITAKLAANCIITFLLPKLFEIS
jgi:agmatinase